MNNFLRWLIGVVVLAVIISLILFYPVSSIIYSDLPYSGLLIRGLYIIILASFLCLFRIFRGPTSADRIVAVDILGILIVGLCALLSISTNRNWYIDIGIAWALQSFISTLALAKYLEGRSFDE